MRMSLWRVDSLSQPDNDQLPLKPAVFKTQLPFTSHGVVIYTHQHKQQTRLKKHPPWPFCCLLGLCSIPAAPEDHCKDPVHTTVPQRAVLTALLGRQTSVERWSKEPGAMWPPESSVMQLDVQKSRNQHTVCVLQVRSIAKNNPYSKRHRLPDVKSIRQFSSLTLFTHRSVLCWKHTAPFQCR